MKGRIVSPIASTIERERTRFELFYDSIEFSGKTVLDIGAGDGYFSLYAALSGADEVVAVEPWDAGSSSVSKGIVSLAETHENIRHENMTIQEYVGESGHFDILLSHSSINHLNESAAQNLLMDQGSTQEYMEIFDHISDLAAKESSFVITDVSRHNFLSFLGDRNPFVSSIEWYKHQSPEVWATLLSHYGWLLSDLQWWSPVALLGTNCRSISNNWLFSHLTSSNFRMCLKF